MINYSFELQSRGSVADRLRNNKPTCINKNVSTIGIVFDKANTYWTKKHKYDHGERKERMPISYKVPNFFFKNRVLWTK